MAAKKRRATWSDVKNARRDGFLGATAFALFHLKAMGESVYAAELVDACGREALYRWCLQNDDVELARYVRRVR